ncbi:EAL domain-containing protein, partial [Citrobacter braakii]
LTDGRPVGAEALLRWRHPQRGLMLPGEFLPAIENQRLMLPLGQWVLTEALRQARRWTALLGRPFPVAVNLSNVQFHASNLLPTIEHSLRQEDVPGHLLELELSERMLMDDLPEVQRKLQQLKQWG